MRGGESSDDVAHSASRNDNNDRDNVGKRSRTENKRGRSDLGVGVVFGHLRAVKQSFAAKNCFSQCDSRPPQLRPSSIRYDTLGRTSRDKSTLSFQGNIERSLRIAFNFLPLDEAACKSRSECE